MVRFFLVEFFFPISHWNIWGNLFQFWIRFMFSLNITLMLIMCYIMWTLFSCMYGNLIKVRYEISWDFLRTKLDNLKIRFPLKINNVKIGLWKEICMWTWPRPFFFFWRRLMGFSTAKHIRAKKIYREFSTPVSMQKHHLMLPRYSHYEYLISKSAEIFCFPL